MQMPKIAETFEIRIVKRKQILDALYYYRNVGIFPTRKVRSVRCNTKETIASLPAYPIKKLQAGTTGRHLPFRLKSGCRGCFPYP